MSTAAPAAEAAPDLSRAPRSFSWTRVALPAVAALAAVNFMWQLGSSSYYVDEIQSIGAAAAAVGHVLHAVSRTELTPPVYFYFLHEWIARTGTEAEWVLRLPSAVCGVLEVGAVYWLASVLGARRAGALGAAALAALSPFLLEFAQRAQGYVFVMLAVTIAVAAAVAAERAPQRRGRWLVIAAAATCISLWLHYTAGFLAVSLCVWILTRRAFPLRERAAFVGACLTAALALVPVLLEQHRSIPVRVGVAQTAGVTGANVERVLGTPLVGRADGLLALAVIVTVAALAVVIAFGDARSPGRVLLLTIAAGEPLALLVASAFGAHLMLTRYAAVSAPFTIVVIAMAVSTAPRPLGVLLALATAAVAITGLAESHQRSGFYLDARGVVSYLTHHVQQGDAVFAPANPGAAAPLVYYGIARFHTQWLGAPPTPAPPARRVWAIMEVRSPLPSTAQVLSVLARAIRPLGLVPRRVAFFPASTPLAVVLEVPAGAAGPQGR